MITKESGRSKVVRTKEEKIEELKKRWSSLSDDEKDLIRRAIKGDPDARESLKKVKQSHYLRPPLSVEEWVSDPYFSGEATQALYPQLKKDLIRLYDKGSYFEVVLTGGTGYGKSFFAVTGLIYKVYQLTNLRNPHKSFGLAPGTPVYFIFSSTSKLQASKTIFRDFRTRMESIPYFNDLDMKMRFNDKSGSLGSWLNFVCTSTNETGAIGMNVYGGLMDEVNFGDNADLVDEQTLNSTRRAKTKAEKLHDSITSRIKGRYMDMGFVPGNLFVISSKNSEMDFTDLLVSRSGDSSNMYVLDYPQWEVKPDDRFSGETFEVFYGGRKYPSRILDDGEGFELPEEDDVEVIDVPVEYREDFEDDIEQALRDIAGKQLPRITPFITQTKYIESMYSDRDDEHPYTSEEWTSGDGGEGFKWDLLCEKKSSVNSGRSETLWKPKVNPEKPRHIHIDPSLTGDATGFCMGHIDRWVEVVLKDRTEDEHYKETRPLIYIDLMLRINAPKGGEIQFSEVRTLIYELAERGFPVSYVSADSYQSRDTIQILKEKGYNAEVKSLDRKPDGYDTLKTTMQQKRLRAYEYQPVIDELKGLKKDHATGKVDHPPKGSKDVSDSLAGVVWSLHEVETSMPSFSALGGSSEDGKKNHPLEDWHDASGGSPMLPYFRG